MDQTQVRCIGVERFADSLSISKHTARRWIAERKVGSVRLGRRVLIPVAEVERLLERGYIPAKRVLGD